MSHFLFGAPFHHTSWRQSGLRPGTLWSRGMQKEEDDSLEDAIERSGPTPWLRLAVAETLRASEHHCGTVRCLAMTREPQAYTEGPDGHNWN